VDDVKTSVSHHKIGDTLVLRFLLQNGATKDITVKLGRRPTLTPG